MINVIQSLISVFLICIFTLFLISNTSSTSVHLWPLDEYLELPLYIVIVASFLFGFVWACLIMIMKNFHHFAELRALKKEVKALREVNESVFSSPNAPTFK